jgi:hypothetical protein
MLYGVQDREIACLIDAKAIIAVEGAAADGCGIDDAAFSKLMDGKVGSGGNVPIPHRGRASAALFWRVAGGFPFRSCPRDDGDNGRISFIEVCSRDPSVPAWTAAGAHKASESAAVVTIRFIFQFLSSVADEPRPVDR